MKKIFYGFIFLISGTMVMSSCNNSPKENKEGEAADTAAAAQASPQEDTTGWISLFNGKDFTGWRGYGKTEVPKAWTIEDGAIKINGSGEGEAGAHD